MRNNEVVFTGIKEGDKYSAICTGLDVASEGSTKPKGKSSANRRGALSQSNALRRLESRHLEVHASSGKIWKTKNSLSCFNKEG